MFAETSHLQCRAQIFGQWQIIYVLAEQEGGIIR